MPARPAERLAEVSRAKLGVGSPHLAGTRRLSRLPCHERWVRSVLRAEHGFRISGLPFLVVGGYPRLQYHGYWVSLVDPWPEYWASNWYDTDDVYVTSADNGYYLMNRRHPGVGIAIRISL